MSALEVQVGGDHYKNVKIQPFQYSEANHLSPIEHTIIKYVFRAREKGGLQDLEKAEHCINVLIELGRKKGYLPINEATILITPLEFIKQKELSPYEQAVITFVSEWRSHLNTRNGKRRFDYLKTALVQIKKAQEQYEMEVFTKEYETSKETFWGKVKEWFKFSFGKDYV